MTVTYVGGQALCGDFDGRGLYCTLRACHDGDHVAAIGPAWMGGTVIARWPRMEGTMAQTTTKPAKAPVKKPMKPKEK